MHDALFSGILTMALPGFRTDAIDKPRNNYAFPISWQGQVSFPRSFTSVPDEQPLVLLVLLVNAEDLARSLGEFPSHTYQTVHAACVLLPDVHISQ